MSLLNKNYINVYRYGNSILEVCYENSVKILRKVKYTPTIFTTSSNRSEERETWKTLSGNRVYPIKFNSIKECSDYIDFYKDVSSVSLFYNKDWAYRYLNETYPQDCVYEPSMIRTYSLDIETATENGFPDIKTASEEILLISLYDSLHNRYHTFAAKDFELPKGLNYEVIKHISNSEPRMLAEFKEFWIRNYPDVVTGWYSNSFDLPYIIRRIDKVLGSNSSNSLSPWGIVKERPVFIKGEETIFYDIAGVSCLDYIDLYKKHATSGTKESYKLDHVAEYELGKKKVDHSEYASFKDFYTLNWNKFCFYNIEDTAIVVGLENKLRLISLVCNVAYDAKINFEDVASPIKTWDVICTNYLNSINVVTPNQRSGNKSESFEGAYVKEVIVGKHMNVVAFDLDSLYPNLAISLNMGPETIVNSTEYPVVNLESLLSNSANTSFAKEANLSVAANGALFSNEFQSFISIILEKRYEKRKLAKREMIRLQGVYETSKDPEIQSEVIRLNNVQHAAKILINSLYGALGNAYFRYFDVRIAEAITITGQLCIRYVMEAINLKLNSTLKTEGVDYCILGDTDSCYFTLEKLVDKVCRESPVKDQIEFMDKVCKQVIEPLIKTTFVDLGRYLNSAKPSAINMKRETLSDVAMVIRKKGYALSVYDVEGVRYEEPKLKVTGLELVRSSTPAPCRVALKEALKKVMYSNEAELQRYVAEFKLKYRELSYKEIAFPRGVSGLSSYKGSPIYSSGCPIHVRAALLFNHHVSRLNLGSSHLPIREGDKIKFLYLIKPNPIHENVIGFSDSLPNEFNLIKYVDYDLMFEKGFLNSLDIILLPLSWEAEPRGTLEDFFA